MIFFNIKTGEKVVFEPGQDPGSRQAHIAAYLNSSDMSPNSLKGQDFGWRLSPEIKDEVDRIKGDMETLEKIGKNVGAGIDEIRDFHIVNYIAEKEFAKEAHERRLKEQTTRFEEEYARKLEELKRKRAGNEDVGNAKIEEPTKKGKQS